MSLKILITGNMGYVGPAVVRHLRAVWPNSHLAGLDTGFFAHCLTDAPALPERQLDVQYFCDVRDVSPEVFDGVDAVVQLAAISNDPMGKAYEDATMEINRSAARRIAEMAKSRSVRSMVFASSCSVYGFAEAGARTETDTLNPLTAYARSKIETETLLRELADDDFSVTCLRFPTACGMSDRLRLDLVLNDFVAAAILNGRIKILSDGTPWRPLIDIRDMALAIEWAIQRPSSAGGDFLAINVGRNESNYQVRELAETVRDCLGDVAIDINPNAAPDKRSYQVDFSRYGALAPRHLPRCSLEQTIRDLAAGIRAARAANPAFAPANYIRLGVLEQYRESGRLTADLRWDAPGNVAATAVA
jgi:nucleoside-diphosphate-sugar epimerase